MNKNERKFKKKSIFAPLKNLVKSRNMFYLLTGEKARRVRLPKNAQLYIHLLFTGTILLFICLIFFIFAKIPGHSLCGRHEELKPLTV